MTPGVDPAVELTDVDLTYQCWGASVCALDHISLRLPAGGWTVISGENGSGKSSLLRVIAGLTRPTAGEVALLGRPLSRLSPGRRAALIAYVRQHPDQGLAAGLTIAEHVIGYGYNAPQFRSQLAALALGDAFPFLVDAWPRPIETLSGGERQVLGIVLQLIRTTPILLLDEAFSALDPIREERILAALRIVAARTTVIQVTHQPDRLRDRATFAIRMKQGRIVEQEGRTHAG